jgi:hypothetical protein
MTSSQRLLVPDHSPPSLVPDCSPALPAQTPTVLPAEPALDASRSWSPGGYPLSWRDA